MAAPTQAGHRFELGMSVVVVAVLIPQRLPRRRLGRRPVPDRSPKDSPVEVLSSGWQPGDDTYHFDNAGIPEFDGPAKWGCTNPPTDAS